MADNWIPLRLFSLLLLAFRTTPVLWWRSCPNPRNLRAAVDQALPTKSPLSVPPWSEISLAKTSKPLNHLRCGHLPHNHVSLAWELLNLESVPDGFTHCLKSPWCLQFRSHMHPSAPCRSSSYHCQDSDSKHQLLRIHKYKFCDNY